MLTPWQRLSLGFSAALALCVAGTAGYMIIEGFSFFDALYQTVTTITTAGFGEVEPMDTTGRVFTLVLIVLGILVILYVLGTVTQIAVEGEIETLLGARRMRGRLRRFRDHYIICGFGRVAQEIARELREHGLDFVVVDANPEAMDRLRKLRYAVLAGDPTSDQVLREAGIDRARCLLAASDSDSANTFIVLTAKSLKRDIFVVARAAHPQGQTRLMQAGADRVVSPYVIAGRQMALAAVQPFVVELFEAVAPGRGDAATLAEVAVTPGSGVAGATLADVLSRAPGLTPLAVRRAGGEMVVGPAAETRLQPGDRLIVIGEERALGLIRPPEAVGGRRA